MIVLLGVGLVCLVLGAEALVRGASEIAEGLGVSSLVVGLTVVAMGTSAPEVAVSIGSSLTGQADVALGNVIGSYIFNVLLILGLSAVIVPLTVSAQLVRQDVPLGIGVSILTLVLAANGRIGRIEGGLLVAGLIAYTTALIVQASSVEAPPPDPDVDGRGSDEKERRHWGINGGLVVGGLVLLVVGARWFVQGAVEGAQRLGVDELVIGLTIVAGGTSLPEFATSVMAGIRGERDIAVGNVVGSNLFNLLGVLGLSALVAPQGMVVTEAALWFDLPVMVAVSVACLPLFFTGSEISRWEGGLFLGCYGAYVTYLILATTHHAALSTYSVVMGAFVLPLLAATLVALSIRSLRTGE